jgi:hypothetical protein
VKIQSRDLNPPRILPQPAMAFAIAKSAAVAALHGRGVPVAPIVSSWRHFTLIFITASHPGAFDPRWSGQRGDHITASCVKLGFHALLG